MSKCLCYITADMAVLGSDVLVEEYLVLKNPIPIQMNY